MIPDSIISTHSPCFASNPTFSPASFCLSTISSLLYPALSAICAIGANNASNTTLIPFCTSTTSDFTSSFKATYAFTKQAPPPTTIPSLTAARVEFNASSIRSFFSFNSLSVAAPTLMIATPFDNLPKRSAIRFLS